MMTRRLELEPATDVSTDLDSLVFWPTVAALKRRRSDGWLAYL